MLPDIEEKGSMTTPRFTLIGAVHLFLMSDDQVLLARRFHTGYEDGNYSVVAGHLDGNEEIKAAMIREAREEVGIDLASTDVQVVGVMHRKSDDERVDFFLASERWSGELRNCEPHKCDDLAWFALDSLPKNMVLYVRRALENYRAEHWFDSFGF